MERACLTQANLWPEGGLLSGQMRVHEPGIHANVCPNTGYARKIHSKTGLFPVSDNHKNEEIGMKRGISLARTALSAIILGLFAVPFSMTAHGATVMEEVIVTAQRSEESLQEVPIAITALTGEMLEDKGIINPSDLQMSAPNVSFTATNFGNSSFSIRGIGRLVISASGEAGVSTHLNEIPVATNLNAIEFFDVQRVEVLRGPQGTLFGRNATGGSINMVTAMPTYDNLNGFVDVEAGDYNHFRVKGAINVPFSDTMAIRLAGFALERDGYIENLAADSRSTVDGSALPNIDDDIDGRDIKALRATWSWDFSENGNVWVQYNQFDEDDDRARITNQICKRTALPTLGCEPNEVGFDSPHLGATTGGLFFALNGLGTIPLGAPGTGQYVTYDHPQPNLGIREMFTDFEPVFEYEEELWSFGADYEFERFTVSLLGAAQETEYLAQMDYNMDVSVRLPASPPTLGLNGRWPTSAPAGGAGGDVTGANGCRYRDGTAGIFGGCVVPNADQRLFALDQADAETEYWTVEARIASQFDGPFNFQLGVSAYENERFGDYYVNANSLDSVGLVGVGLIGFPPLYPTMFNVAGNPDDPSGGEGQAIFAEGYFDLTDRLKLTLGARYNKDEKHVNDANQFLASADQYFFLNNFLLPGAAAGTEAALGLPPGSVPATPATAIAAGSLHPDYQAALSSMPGNTLGGVDRRWGRLGTWMIGAPASAAELAIMQANGVSQADIDAASATQAFSPERAAISNTVGPTQGFNELRAINGNPSDNEWTSTTGRIGLDYQMADDVLLYAFFSRGYKPGGFNPPIGAAFQDDTSFAFDEEEVDSIEVGFKSTLLDGQLTLNGTAFLYDYTGLQVTRIRNNSSINENIDADIMGAELEWVWQPAEIEGLAIDGSFAWLDTSLDGAESVDVINKTAGNPDWINLKNIDPGALTATNYIAHLPSITPELINAAYTNTPAPAALSDVNGTAVPGTVYANGVPAYFSRNFLNGAGVQTSAGLLQSLDGNQLPNSPEYTVNLGVQYTWGLDAIAGDLTVRWDYYWQDDSYGREFNTVGDEIASWDQHNLSFIYESRNGDWQARLWARNLQDEDNVTGHYLTSDTSGYYRNWFLTEPRVYGLSVRYQFGAE